MSYSTSTFQQQQQQQQQGRQGAQSLAELVEQLTRFDGPPEQFLLNLLAVQCHVAGAEGGAIMRPDQEGKPEVLSVYPPLDPEATTPVWLALAVESCLQVIQSARTQVTPLGQQQQQMYGEQATQCLIQLPLPGPTGVRGVTAFVLPTTDQAAVQLAHERLELTMGLLNLYEMRLTLELRKGDLKRLRESIEVLASINENDRMRGAAMALCNEVATRWGADRVSIGFLEGRYVKIHGLSHTEKFTRKMKLIQDLEASMEECIDQDVEVIYPPNPDASYVYRSTSELSSRHGPSTICSLPLRRQDEPEGVLLVERAQDRPFTLDEIEMLRLTCDLTTARMLELHDHDLWFGEKFAKQMKELGKKVVGPEYTWVKLAGIAVTALIIFLSFAKGDYKVEAPFVVEATKRQIIPAPFDGYLKDVLVEPGHQITAYQSVLATIETAELQLQLVAAIAEYNGYVKEADIARSEGKTAEVQIANAQADRISSQVRLLRYQIDHATIMSPIDGVVLTGDLKKELGRPLQTGDVMFEVAPLESMRAEMSVPEDVITEVQAAFNRGETLEGELAAASHPGNYLPFEVELVNPIAEVTEQKNVFRVRLKLKDTETWMRPGMEGIAKIHVDRRHYAWIWSRELINWLRMKLWI